MAKGYTREGVGRRKVYVEEYDSDSTSSIKEKESDDSDYHESTESDDSDEQHSRMKTEKKPPKLPSKATIYILAETEEQLAASARNDLSHVDNDIVARIVKSLNLAHHSGTGEAEAKAALRMAHKLMAKHSVSQAAALAAMESKTEKIKKAGMSTVAVQTDDEDKIMNLSTWSASTANAMTIFFDCKYYTESLRYNRIDFVFYGLAEQTVAAAYAFEMTYNLILTWRLQNKMAKGLNAKNAYCRGVADGLLKFAKQEKAKEKREAERKEKQKLEDAKSQEEEERKREILRLQQPQIKWEEAEDTPIVKKEEEQDESHIDGKFKVKVEEEEEFEKPVKKSEKNNGRDSSSQYSRGYEDESDFPGDNPIQDGNDNSDDESDSSGNDGHSRSYGNNDEDDDEVRPDFEHSNFEKDEERLFGSTVKKEEEVENKPFVEEEYKEVTIKKEEDEDDVIPWESARQLVAFRNNALEIADAYLKETGLKLRNRRQPKMKFTDQNARESYYQGQEDAKKIDVKRRRIMETEEDSVY